MNKSYKIILLSGFEPFGGEKINPSWEVVRNFQDEKIGDYKIEVTQLPVSFKKAKSIIWDTLTNMNPDYYIALGQAGGITKIQFERIALNLMDARIPDNDKYKPEDQPIFQDAPLAYRTNIPIKKLRDELLNAKIPATISNHAGAYVCNLVFFTALHATYSKNLKTKVGFIHIPFIFEQVLNKNSPSFPLEYVKKALKIVLKKLIETK